VAMSQPPKGRTWPGGSRVTLMSDELGRVDATGTTKFFPLPRLVKDPQAITAGPDGNLWVGSAQNGHILRVATSGEVASFPALIEMGPVLGADGNLWYTNSSSIYRMTPTGETTAYPVLPHDYNLEQLIRGSDGDIWFVSHADTLSRQGGGAIGRITTQG